jgi:hypothetical protein
VTGYRKSENAGKARGRKSKSAGKAKTEEKQSTGKSKQQLGRPNGWPCVCFPGHCFVFLALSLFLPFAFPSF